MELKRKDIEHMIAGTRKGNYYLENISFKEKNALVRWCVELIKRREKLLSKIYDEGLADYTINTVLKELEPDFPNLKDIDVFGEQDICDILIRNLKLFGYFESHLLPEEEED